MPTIRQIAQLGHPVLRERAAEVSDILDPEIQRLVDDLFLTVNDAPGVGLAAPQVYESSRIFVIASRPNLRYAAAPVMEPVVMINPKILWSSEDQAQGWEGCLSIPGIRALVPRHTSIRVSYQDRLGVEQTAELQDFIARVFQHEYDHLEGLVFFDRLDSPRDIVTEREYARLMMAKS